MGNRHLGGTGGNIDKLFAIAGTETQRAVIVAQTDAGAAFAVTHIEKFFEVGAFGFLVDLENHFGSKGFGEIHLKVADHQTTGFVALVFALKTQRLPLQTGHNNDRFGIFEHLGKFSFVVQIPRRHGFSGSRQHRQNHSCQQPNFQHKKLLVIVNGNIFR